MSFDISWLHNTAAILDDPRELLQEYIVNQKLPIHDPQPFILPRQSEPTNLYHVPFGTASTTLVADRDPITGQILEFIETKLEDAECTAKNSMSMRRAPVRPEQATRGSATNFPFWPGGFDEPATQIESLKLNNSVFEKNLLTVAPGFSQGLEFSTDTKECSMESALETTESVDLLSIVEDEQSVLGMWKTDETTSEKLASNQFEYNEELDEIILSTPTAAPVLDISKTRKPKVQSMEYAEWVDITQPVKDFEKQVPELALKFAFELDTFQKQAIIKLENHNHIFVSAHTSAGKTVVAEYAIALSQKHMTRTIYTSPIKALSNQKYRDFKQRFDDVGIITGDIQINPSSVCLIMTTEILRSMLYCGSEVTRDLEYVIFDEVHYITDLERGHVWEEVLILLPDHVNIIMLSATVPNALKFSNWVGMTKRKKVYVISTSKRPVPLKHYLYTGHNGLTKKEMFLIVDADGHFVTKGYSDARAAKMKSDEKREAKRNPRPGDNKSNRGGGGGGGGGGSRGGGVGGAGGRGGANRGGGMSLVHETQIYLTLIDLLKQNDELPIIAFTLSRNKCDLFVKELKSLNLTKSGAESGAIRTFFNKCMSKLKPEDRNIPQVLTLQESLARGIGVHHSGILPILKEVVELLFQSGHVKLLFATETFAMGVNMPARTVVFDSFKKHDGKELRPILPAEYTQMAGRAGRRGIDKNGTVILLCKAEVPSDIQLKTMITGQPMNLESKFRLTYAMILNLFRVESVSVEDMMSHSFKEFEKQSTKPETIAKLKAFEQQMSEIPEIGPHMEPLCKFFDCAYEYILTYQRFMNRLAASKLINLKPGRLIYISHRKYHNRFGIYLSTQSPLTKPLYNVLILDNDANNDEIGETTENISRVTLTDNKPMANSNKSKPREQSDLWHRMIALTKPRIYKLNTAPGFRLLTIEPSDLIDITTTTFKVDADAILNNWSQRQKPRFRDAPVGPSTEKAINDLYSFHKSLKSEKSKIPFVNFKQEFKMIQDLDLITHHRRKMEELLPHTKIANFEQEFAPVFDRKQLEAKQAELRFKMSHQSLILYPEYQYKLEVLKRMNYVDDQHSVTLKGRVACEMGSNELMITELVLCNTFNDLDPPEIAALLSSLVFQGKSKMDPEKIITDNLKGCVETIKSVEREIRQVEDAVMTTADKDVRESAQMIDGERLNFGLVRVVYEWARNKPFAEIMNPELTDIQEGVIVRCIQQLNETLQDVKDAARIIGNPTLYQKMEEASNAIKRDIVFAASLYFQD